MENKLFTFVKCRAKMPNGNYIEYNDWMLLIEDIDTLNQYHFEIKMNKDAEIMECSIMRLSEPDFKARNHEAVQLYEQYEKNADKGMLQLVADFSSRAHLAQIKYISLGYKIIINNNGGYFFLTDDIEITNKWVVKSIHLPFYTESDIRVKRFREGEHYYAKIDYIDVVDKEGCQKWDTFNEAYSAAKEYLKTLK